MLLRDRDEIGGQHMQADLMPSTLRILLVDDDEPIRECLTELLADAGWRVTPAASATQALQIAEVIGVPDIIVTDLLLGRGMNGVALVAAARQRWPLVRAVLISGAGGSDPVLAPCDRYLRKPFSSKALIQLVTTLAGAERHTSIAGPFATSHHGRDGMRPM